MSGPDWRWKLGEATERIRTRYDRIGRKTAAPFLAIAYPPDEEAAVLHEWRALTDALAPEFEVRRIDVLEVTQRVIADISAEGIVDSILAPMPGSDPVAELGSCWVAALADEVRSRLSEPGTGRPPVPPGTGRPFVSLERTAALWPASGPRSVMQSLWDSAQSALEGPVVVMIPGHLCEARTYRFVGHRDEFMYRGDLL